jgi:hypothetical protein
MIDIEGNDSASGLGAGEAESVVTTRRRDFEGGGVSFRTEDVAVVAAGFERGDPVFFLLSGL